MLIHELMEQKKLTKYRLSKNTGIPYTTVSDICNGKVQLEKCTAETVYKLAKEFGVSMEKLLESSCEPRCSFELFKSNVCHRVKEREDIEFLREVLISDEITLYYERRWYPECFYLLAMTDYLSRLHEIPLCEKYNALRKGKLEKTVYPSGVIALAAVNDDAEIKKLSVQRAIPEFLRHNIVEVEVRDVV